MSGAAFFSQLVFMAFRPNGTRSLSQQKYENRKPPTRNFIYYSWDPLSIYTYRVPLVYFQRETVVSSQREKALCMLAVRKIF